MANAMPGSEEAHENASKPQPIGLSFGNSYSSIAYTTADGKSEVIANEEGDRQIPSILSYVVGEEFVGSQAKAQLVRNPRNTIAFFRDFLGKGFADVDVSHCHGSAHPVPADGGKTVGFEIVENSSAGENEDKQTKEGEKSLLSVEDVTARHFKRLRQSASDFLGYDVSSAVVTVPTNVSQQQTAALTAAARKAGIEILQTISEPVAALLAHDAKQQLAANDDSSSAVASDSKQQDQIIVVADFGSTRSDVAVLASRGGIYTTLATAHDYSVGGAALDQVLIDYAAKEFLKKHKSASDPRENERSIAKLKLEAEAVKKALSLGSSANFSIESLGSGYDFNLSVNRTRFELLANKVLTSFARLVESAVTKADLDPLDVDAILLSGGSSHVPKVASNLASYFPESATVIAPSTLPTAINPSELAARGAAIQASLVGEFEHSDIEASTETVVTVTPHTSNAIGVVFASGAAGQDHFAVIVPPETPVPARRTAQVSVPAGGDVLIRLAEGTREIKVIKEARPSANGEKVAEDDVDEDEDDEDDEPEEIREKVYQPGKVLTEAAIKGVKKNGKVEVQVNIGVNLALTVVCREVGGKGGVRGVVQGEAASQNGAAS